MQRRSSFPEHSRRKKGSSSLVEKLVPAEAFNSPRPHFCCLTKQTSSWWRQFCCLSLLLLHPALSSHSLCPQGPPAPAQRVEGVQDLTDFATRSQLTPIPHTLPGTFLLLLDTSCFTQVLMMIFKQCHSLGHWYD